MLRPILAFLLAPFPGALLQAILVALRLISGRLAIYQHPASMFVAMCFFHYALGLVLGVPLYLTLRRRTGNRLWAYALAGTLIVVVPLALISGWAAAQSGIPVNAGWPMTYGFLRFGIAGLLTGATFWFLARPDGREERRRAAAEKVRLSGAFQ